MKKKLIAIALAFTMAFTLTGCLDDLDEDIAETSEETEKEDGSGNEDGKSDDGKSDDGKSDDGQDSGSSDGSHQDKAISLNVNRSSGKMNIVRASSTDNRTGDPGWTVFVYLCGTDLESDGGMGTGDLEEMLEADTDGNVRFVIQTGGTNEWQNSTVDQDKIQRYVVSSGEIELVDEKSLDGMGKTSTLQDFLNWGATNYSSEHMGVIFWNHGGGSITGVCFDETDDYDSLSLKELSDAFYSCMQNIDRKFDFIGFDACLMGSVECANVLATYADYMYGSEETEPGSGWDYTAIGDFLNSDPDADGADLGKVVCDSFLAACKAQAAGIDNMAKNMVIDAVTNGWGSVGMLGGKNSKLVEQQVDAVVAEFEALGL